MLEKRVGISHVQKGYLNMSNASFAQERRLNSEKRALVVLGHNIEPLSGVIDGLIDDTNLSIYSKMSAYAAGVLLNEGEVDSVFFSSGHTRGQDFPSEARAMKDYLLSLKRFKGINPSSIYLEDESLDTSGNAIMSKEKVDILGFKQVGIMTTSDHFPNSLTIFNRNGFAIRREDCFISEIELARYFEENGIKLEHDFLDLVKRRDVLGLIAMKEFIREFMLETFDYDGKILSMIAKILRK